MFMDSLDSLDGITGRMQLRRPLQACFSESPHFASTRLQGWMIGLKDLKLHPVATTVYAIFRHGRRVMFLDDTLNPSPFQIHAGETGGQKSELCTL